MFDEYAPYGAKEKVLEILRSGAKEGVIQEKLELVLARTTELDLNYSTILDEGAKQIAKVLEVNKTLHTLRLAYNSIGPAGAKHIAEALKVNKTLQVLYISSNNTGLKRAEQRAKALEVNKTLQNMRFSTNNIKSEGIKSIANALKKNSTVRILHVKNRRVPFQVQDLIDLLKHNNGLRELAVNVTASDVFSCNRIANTIEFCNITITSLIGGKWIGSRGHEPYLDRNGEIATKISDLVAKNAKLSKPLYDDVVKTIKIRSMSEYYVKFFYLTGVCQDIYTNDLNLPISNCPPEILYKMAEMYTESKFQFKYDITPTVCRVTLPLVLERMKHEIAEASAVSR